MVPAQYKEERVNLIVRLMVEGSRKLAVYNIIGMVMSGVLVHYHHGAYIFTTAMFATLAVFTVCLGWLGWALNGVKGTAVYTGIRDITMYVWLLYAAITTLNLLFPSWDIW